MPEVVAEVPARVLAVYAHPDDADVAAGGTLARWASAGAEIHVAVCAQGDKGTSDPDADVSALVDLRRRETVAAGAVLGVTEHHWLGYADGETDSDGSLTSRLVELVRTLRPDAVVGADPTAVFFGGRYVNHRDHRSVGWATLDAVAPAAASPRYFPGAGAAHQVAVLYLSGTLEPDVWVDVTATIEAKAKAVASHGSQLGQPGEWVAAAVRERAEEAGRKAGLRYAEGFRRILLA